MAEIVAKSSNSLSELIDEMRRDFPSSGEINISLDDHEKGMSRVENHFREDCQEMSRLDGLSMSFNNWRFNLRSSNTESLLRLNVEARKDTSLIVEKVNEIKNLIA